VNSEEIREEQVRAAAQATVYALLDYFDPRGFGGGFVCPVSADRRQQQSFLRRSERGQGEYKLNKRWSASVTRDENGGFAVDGKYRKRY
jgi:hypothetical protein